MQRPTHPFLRKHAKKHRFLPRLLVFDTIPLRDCGKISAMRVDKFLKVSRLIKRREVAKQLCDAGYVQHNGKQAKPSTEVEPGDELVLRLGRHTLTVKVLALLPHANKESASAMYEVIEDKIENRGNEDA